MARSERAAFGRAKNGDSHRTLRHTGLYIFPLGALAGGKARCARAMAAAARECRRLSYTKGEEGHLTSLTRRQPLESEVALRRVCRVDRSPQQTAASDCIALCEICATRDVLLLARVATLRAYGHCGGRTHVHMYIHVIAHSPPASCRCWVQSELMRGGGTRSGMTAPRVLSDLACVVRGARRRGTPRSVERTRDNMNLNQLAGRLPRP